MAFRISRHQEGAYLVVFFSRPGENFNVGVVAEGSTAKLAHIVAESTGAPMVRIVPDQPIGYDDAKQIIQHELETQARPAIRLEALASEPFDAEQAIAAADRIALGYPIWCGSLPMPYARSWTSMT